MAAPRGTFRQAKQISMSDFQHSSDSQASKLDSALARIDQVIDSVTKKLDEQRYEHRTVVEERDAARIELDELRRRYDELQAKADHAADRIEVLIGIVERSFPDLALSVTEGGQQEGDHHDHGHHHEGHHHEGHHHEGGEHQPQQHSYGY